MKRIIRLTERDLTRIIRRVIKENDYKPGEFAQADLEKYATDNSSDYKKGNNGGYTTYTYDGNEYQITISLSEDKSYEKGFAKICITTKGGSKMCDSLNMSFYNRNWDSKELNDTINVLKSYTK
jgi:hypothetical protein